MIHFERRLGVPRWLTGLVPILSLILAAVLVALVLMATGHDPVATYEQIFQAAFTNPGAIRGTFIFGTPLLFTGLCAAVAFRMRVWNIGGEGQLYMGAVGASGAGLALGGEPALVVIPAMIIAGALAGMIWAAIPGILRAYGSTNEILTSLMLNYVAGLLTYYLIYDSASFWRDLVSPAARVFPLGRYLSANAGWPGIGADPLSIPMGFLLGAGVAALIWVVIRSTGFGFEMRVIGDSPGAADYAGIRTRRKVVAVMALSGAIAGLAGASQVGDFGHVLDPRGLQQSGYGYTGIVVAALALYNPLAVVLVAFFLGALNNAGFALQGPGFPLGLVGVMEGIILFCVLGGELIVRYRVGFGARRAPPAADALPALHHGEGSVP